MVKAPLISIITPALNASATLARAIESVRAQNITGDHFTGWEMIIIDDHSQDSTCALAAKMAEQDERIRVIRCAENGGAARACNMGLDAARGRYIAFLNAEDIWMPDKLQRQLDAMHDNGLALSATWYRRYAALEKPRRVQKLPKSIGFDTLLSYPFTPLSTMMIDRAQTGAFHFGQSLPPCKDWVSEDWAAWLALTKSGYDIHVVQQDLARVRIKPCRGVIAAIRHIASIVKTGSRTAGLRGLHLFGYLARYAFYAARRRLF